MYTSDDGDSRDSGFSETMTESRPNSSLGATQFSTIEELCDMDEVFAANDELVPSAEETTTITSPTHPAVERIRALGDTTNCSASSPLSRNSAAFQGRIYKTKSTVLFCRKRALSQEDVEEESPQSKRLRAMSAAAAAEHDDTPPSRKFVRRPPRAGFLQRVNSTSILEIKHTTNSSSEPPPIASINYSLPVVAVKDSTAAFRRIHADTLRGLMTSLPREEFLERFLLVDCRYPYEFRGGHIQHAVNLFDTSLCENFFFSQTQNTSRIPIFYCEYSQKRGPGMAVALRSVDRIRNIDHYPNVTFGEIYVLDQGYKGFFHSANEEVHKALCEPSEYVPMDDDRFGHELKKYNFHRKNCSGATSMKPKPLPITSRPSAMPKKNRHRPPARRGLFETLSLPPPEAVVVPAVVVEEREDLNTTTSSIASSTPDLQPQRLSFS